MSTPEDADPKVAETSNVVEQQQYTQQDDDDMIIASSAEEDGSLLHLYESRLRRLRENADLTSSRAYSKYTNNSLLALGAPSWQRRPIQNPSLSSSPKIDPIVAQQAAISSRPSTSIRQQHPFLPAGKSPTSVVLERARDAPPLVISVRNDDYADDDGESVLDDLTISTGYVSNMTEEHATTPAFAASPSRPTLRPIESASIAQSSASEDMESSRRQNSSSPAGDGNNPYSAGAANGPEPIMIAKVPSGSSSHSSEGEEEEEDGEYDDCEEQKSEYGDKYTVHAAYDSKYEAYSLMVDSEQGDRAVEIPLYSAARPHMRAFHFAWVGFFVAFFNWFGIAPLLSEVANSLNLTRKEVWTSNTLAVASSAISRVMAGPLNDIYGSRWVMSIALLISAVPAIISGLVIHGKVGLYIIRFLVGVAGCTFVTCQFWTASMFTVEVAGTALSLVAGWGNLGGGVSQVVMGSILFPLFKVIYGGEGYSQSTSGVYPGDNPDEEVEYDRAADLAWRTVLAIPGIMCAYVAYICIRYADDTPKGNVWKRKRQGLMNPPSPWYALGRGARNFNTWLMFFQYSCCFGVELTMTSAAALYFQEEFGQSTPSAAAIASIFGWMNLFARGLGGFASDMACATHGIRGRLWVQVVCLVAEGALVCVFSVTDTLASAIVVMAAFSIFVQAAEGSTFGIVPYIDYSVTGSISGIIGAGGNSGAVAFSLVFRQFSNRTSFFVMGCTILVSSILSAFVFIPGHKSLFCGEDTREVEESRIARTEQVGIVPNIEITGRNHQDGQANPQNRQSQLRPVSHSNTVEQFASSSPTTDRSQRIENDDASIPSTGSSTGPE